jgi:hypothetical protein
MHSLLQAHHREWAGVDGLRWQDEQLLNEEVFERYFEEEKAELGDLPADTRRLFRAYLKHWGLDSERYRVAQLHDGSPAIEFVVEFPLTKWSIEFPFKGRIDLIVEDLEYGGLWIWDHKWVKRIPGPDERMMSPQALMYVWALRKLGYDIRGFVFNYGRTKPPTVPYVLKNGTVTTRKRLDTDYYTYLETIKKTHPDNWRTWVQRVYMPKLKELNHRQHTDWFMRERIPVEPERIKRALVEFLVTIRDIERRNTKHPPRSYFYNCAFSCEFHDICCAEFQGLDIEPLIKRQFTFDKERYGETTEST